MSLPTPKPANWTPLERVLTTLGHQEPDRVPLFLLPTIHGARQLGVTIQNYFSRAENVVLGQLQMRAKYQQDCLYSFFYAAVEVEAWGGEVAYREDGPPNSGEPFLRQFEGILGLEPPRIEDCACLTKVLSATQQLKESAGDAVPIVGVVMSPFSLPVMQMGFEPYLELLEERPALWARLMQVNEEFCVAWANAQLRAGATAITYFDPVGSSTIIPPATYSQTAREVARRTLSRIAGPIAIHFASGRCRPILDQVATLGAAVVGVSSDEDLVTLKAALAGRMTLLGNLNGIAMCRWTEREAESAVKEAIAKAGRGGGFMLADCHGEIPWQVPEDVLLSIGEATRRWGQYPLDWVERDGT